MDFTIPKEFSLGGSKITVTEKDSVNDDPSCDGLAVYGKLRIDIRKDTSGDYREYIYFHELTHHILNQMGSEKRSDEIFVSLFATFLHQAIKTMK